MNRVWIGLIVCATILCTFGRAEGNRQATTADSLYQAALAGLDTARIAESLDGFERVLEADRRYAPAYNQMAQLYLRLNTVNDRQRAEKAAREAARLDRRNLEYQLTLGDVMWAKGLWSKAVGHYKSVLKKHPEAARAAYRVGYFALNEYMNMKDRREIRNSDSLMARVRGAFPMERGSSSTVEARDMMRDMMKESRPMAIPFDYFAQKEMQRAATYLEKTIAIDPDFRDGYYQLGLLFFELNKPENMVQTMRRLLDRTPNDKDALLFTGLGYLKLNDIALADGYFASALRQMSPEERSRIEDVELILTDRERMALPLLASVQTGAWRDTPDHEAFWRKNDPLLLSGANERRLEHYARFAYANLCFSRPLRNVEGWRTDRGEVYLKYGRPRTRSTNVTEFGLQETWGYHGFGFTFRSMDGYYGWRGASRKAAEKKAGAQHYLDPYHHQKYTLPNLITAFKDGDSIRVELAYAIPEAKLQPDANGRLRLADGLYLFDANWREVISKPVAISAHAKTARDPYYITQHTLYVAPGDYWVVAEVVDYTSHAIGTFRKPAAFARSDTSLAVSDLLLADRIESAVPMPQSRADLNILPNPLRTYRRAQSVFLYFECYNLARNAFNQTRYTIAYKLGRPKTDVDASLFSALDFRETESQFEIRPIFKPSWTAGMDAEDVPYQIIYKPNPQNLIGQNAFPGMGFQTSSEYEGDRTDDFTFLEIDIHQLPAGIYELTIAITDQHSGAQIEQRTLLRIIE